MVATLTPRATSTGMARTSRLVLPAPLHPASPITRMPDTTDRLPRDVSTAPRGRSGQASATPPGRMTPAARKLKRLQKRYNTSAITAAIWYATSERHANGPERARHARLQPSLDRAGMSMGDASPAADWADIVTDAYCADAKPPLTQELAGRVRDALAK